MIDHRWPKISNGGPKAIWLTIGWLKLNSDWPEVTKIALWLTRDDQIGLWLIMDDQRRAMIDKGRPREICLAKVNLRWAVIDRRWPKLRYDWSEMTKVALWFTRIKSIAKNALLLAINGQGGLWLTIVDQICATIGQDWFKMRYGGPVMTKRALWLTWSKESWATID